MLGAWSSDLGMREEEEVGAEVVMVKRHLTARAVSLSLLPPLRGLWPPRARRAGVGHGWLMTLIIMDRLSREGAGTDRDRFGTGALPSPFPLCTCS